MNDAGSGADQPEKGTPPPSPPSAAALENEGPLACKVRIFVVDDHPVVRKGLQMLLDLQPDMQVCGEAVGLATAQEGITQNHPDLVVVDLGLEDGDGFELMDWLQNHHPHIRMLVFTSHDDLAFTERAFKCGAQGYVVKHDGTRELIRAIRLVMQNRPYISSKVVEKHQPAPRPRTKD